MEDFVDSIKFVWWQGVVEDRNDPLQLGRCRVRILGFHPQERTAVATEQLPWAFPLQDITSAAMSGIGHAPVGPVEGTWVIGFFRDGENAQEPVIMGTIGGIPQAPVGNQQGLGFYDPNGKYPLVGNNPLQDAVGELTSNAGIKIPGISTDELAEALGVDPTLVSQAQDIASGVQGQVETAQDISADVQAQIETAVGSAITDATGIEPSAEAVALAASSIVADRQDQIASAAEGVLGGLGGTQAQVKAVEDIVAESTDSIKAAALSAIAEVPGFDSITSGLESQVAGAVGGVLSQLAIIGKGIEQAASGVRDALKQAQEKALAAASKNVSSVLDGLPGDNAVTSLAGIADGAIEVDGLSFSTPGLGEPDTSRLARTDGQVIFGRNSDEHPVVSQKTNVLKIPGFPGVPIEASAPNANAPLNKGIRQIETANSFVSWFEPPTCAAFTEYPFNHVFESESGHIQEFDDTPGFERIHTFHKSGTFEEIHPSGDRMVKVVGTSYEIIHSDNNLLVKGDLNITVDDQARIKVQNTCDIEVVNGTLQIVVRKGNLNLQVQEGNANVFVKGNLNTQVLGDKKEIILGRYVLDVAGTISIRCGGSCSIRGATIFLN